MDNLSRQARSKVMASIKGKDTSPELVVRRLLWAKGKRYRVHDKGVPGTPDITSSSKKVAVFIDGCFWHGCAKCYREPTSNVSYWRSKLVYNVQRRKTVEEALHADGWKVLRYWEHVVLSDPGAVAIEISTWL